MSTSRDSLMLLLSLLALIILVPGYTQANA